MKIWIDADACPGAVKEIIYRAADKRQVKALFIANTPLYLPPSPFLQAIQVEAGADVADAYIAEHAQPGDLVISQDIPLAAQLVDKKVTIITPHGKELTEANIGERLTTRNILDEIRSTGQMTGGPKPFGEKDKRQFANTFDQLLTKLIRQGAS